MDPIDRKLTQHSVEHGAFDAAAATKVDSPKDMGDTMLQRDNLHDELLIELGNMPEFVIERMMPENLECFTGQGHVKRLKCRLCDKVFRHLDNMRKHLRTEHNQSKFMGAKRRNSLEIVSADATVESMACPNCERSFPRKSTLTKHIRGHCKGKKQEDENKGPRNLLHDPLWNEELQQYMCNLCSKSFSYKNHLTAHINFHAKLAKREQNYKMRLSNVSSGLPDNNLNNFELDEAKSTSQENKSQSKNLEPPENTSLDDSIKPNQDESHKKRQETIECFEDLNQSLADSYWNEELQLYECDQCDKTCVHRNHLTNHLKRHQKKTEKNVKSFWNQQLMRYECKRCKLPFYKANQMRIHLTQSTDCDSVAEHETDVLKDEDDEMLKYWNATLSVYVCDHCDKMCVHRNHLRNHLKKHSEKDVSAFFNTDKAMYECQRCDLKFIMPNAIRQHLEENPYCGRVVDREAARVRQLEIEQDEFSKYWIADRSHYLCDQCPKTFLHRNTMANHKKSHEKFRREDVEFWKKLTRGNSRVDFDKLMNPGSYLFLNKYWDERLERYECDQCEKMYISRKPMVKHLWSHNNVRPTIIESVLLDAPKEEDVAEELPDEREVNGTSDDSIDSDSATDDASERTTKTYSCEICHEVFCQKNPLKRHMRSVHKSCSMSLPTAAVQSCGMLDAKRRIGKRKRYECKLCSELFVGLAKLNEHLKNKHAHSKKRKSCSSLAGYESADTTDYSKDKEGFLLHCFSLKPTDDPNDEVFKPEIVEVNVDALSPSDCSSVYYDDCSTNSASEFIKTLSPSNLILTDRSMSSSSRKPQDFTSMDWESMNPFSPCNLDLIDPIQLEDDFESNNELDAEQLTHLTSHPNDSSIKNGSDTRVRIDYLKTNSGLTNELPVTLPNTCSTMPELSFEIPVAASPADLDSGPSPYDINELSKHRTPNRFFCKTCFNFYCTREELENHQHLQCTVCPKLFASNNRLIFHMNRDHTN